MDDSSLEQYFDNFIANDILRTEKQEEVSEGQEDLFYKLLPDELLTLSTFTGEKTEKHQHKNDEISKQCLPTSCPTAQHLANTLAESSTVDKSSPDSSRGLDYNFQNSSAGAEFAQASSSEPEASAVNPMTPAVPEILEDKFPKPTPVICNVVSTVNLGCHLDLDIIACNMWNVEYNPKIFKALVMRNREPKATLSLFANGKMVCFGAESIVKSHLVARKFARKLQKFGLPVRFLNFKIKNLVATCRAFPVNLKKLHSICSEHCSYNSEIFTGLFYKGIPGISVTVFGSGSIILCGAKSPDEVYEAAETTFSFMKQCRE